MVIWVAVLPRVDQLTKVMPNFWRAVYFIISAHGTIDLCLCKTWFNVLSMYMKTQQFVRKRRAINTFAACPWGVWQWSYTSDIDRSSCDSIIILYHQPCLNMACCVSTIVGKTVLVPLIFVKSLQRIWRSTGTRSSNGLHENRVQGCSANNGLHGDTPH